MSRLMVVRDDAGASVVHTQSVTGNFFTALGVGALRGRALTPEDDSPAITSPAVWAGPTS